MFQLVWDRHRCRERRFYFQTHVLLPCLHVTHGALCPSPTGTVVNSRPKYVKVNPSRAAPRRAALSGRTCLKVATIMAEAARGSLLGEDPPRTPWEQLQTTANSSLFFFLFSLPLRRHVAPGSVAGLLLSSGRGLAARRAALPAQTPRAVRLLAARRRRTPAAAARATAALARLAAAAARRFHGRAVLRSAEPQQLARDPELVSLLGRLVGECSGGYHPWRCSRAPSAAYRSRQPAGSARAFNIFWHWQCPILYVELTVFTIF